MLDTDDWWEPPNSKTSRSRSPSRRRRCVLVHTGVLAHLPNGTTSQSDLDAGQRRTGWCTQALLEPTSIGHPSIMVLASALNKINGYDETFRQACDINLYFRLSAVGTFAFVPQFLLHYRKHEKQMSTGQADQIPFHHRAIKEFFEQHPDIAEKNRPNRN